MKKLGANLLLLAIASLVAAVGLEFGVRWAIPRFDPSGTIEFHTADGGLPLGPRESVRRQFKNTGDYDVEVAFNRHGLRDRRDVARATAGDWFVVGDSYSFGWGVEESERFSDVLEVLLGRRVFNLSVPTHFLGYAKLVGYAASLGAPVDRLVVGICMENDLLDYDVLERDPGADRRPGVLRRAKAWLARESALYSALTTVVHHRPALRGVAVRLGLVVENIAGMRRNEYSASIIEESVERYRQLVEGRESIALIIPSRGLWVGGNEAEERRVHEEFVAALRAAGLHVVDVRPRFEAGGDPMQFHFENDGHWNARGHREAALALRDAITREDGG